MRISAQANNAITSTSAWGSAAAAQQWRTPLGHPDLQGTWSSDDVRGIPLQRPEEMGTRAYVTTFTGFEAHSSMTHLGVSAIHFAGDFIQETGPSKDVDFLYAAVTFTF